MSSFHHIRRSDELATGFQKFFVKEKKMDEKLLALLVKSRLFSSNSHNLFSPIIRINALRDYKFFICNCFIGEESEDKIPHFSRYVESFIKRYLNSWTQIAENETEKGIDWKFYSQKVFDLFKDFDWKKIYNEIKSGEDSVNLEIRANDSKIRIMRFGNILGFNILNKKGEKHKSGLKAIESLCRANDPSNNQGVYEIVHSAKISFSIPEEKSTYKEYTFDFQKIFQMLNLYMKNFQWAFDLNELIGAYKKNGSAYFGKIHGFEIKAKLVHTQRNLLHDRDELTWRQGNIEKEDATTCKFKNGDDIHLELTIESSLPGNLSLGKTDPSFDFHTEQFKFAEVVAIFISQICAMQLDRYRKSREPAGD